MLGSIHHNPFDRYTDDDIIINNNNNNPL